MYVLAVKKNYFSPCFENLSLVNDLTFDGDKKSYIEWNLIDSSGWISVSGVINILQGQPHFYLEIEASGRKKTQSIAVSRKGLIKDVVNLPKETSKVRLYILASDGQIVVESIKLEPLHAVKAWWRMFRRVALYVYAHDRDSLAKAGLSLSSCFLNLQQAYKRVGQQRALSTPLSYSEWVEYKLAYYKQKNIFIKDESDKAPTISLVIYEQEIVDKELAKSTISSIAKLKWSDASLNVIYVQTKGSTNSDILTLPNVKCIALDDFRAAVLSADIDADWFLILRCGVELDENALLTFSKLVNKNSTFDIWYSDHDHFSEDGHLVEPCFKPDWSPHFQKVSHYCGDLMFARKHVLSDLLSKVSELHGYDLWLKAASWVVEERIGHCKAVLWHQSAKSSLYQPDLNILTEHYKTLGIRADIEPYGSRFLSVHFEVPSPPPLVSIIVPTRDMLSMLKPCIASLIEKTTYSNFEIIVVDNQSSCTETLAFLREISDLPNFRVLNYDRAFNYSAINNFAVAHSAGELICLLNNDTEVIAPDWLERMVGLLCQDGVGAVGAKLLYSNGTVQHAGDAVGPGGCADHMHSGIPGDAPGYMSRAILSQELSAVTAACLLTHRSLYNELGGLNEQSLAVAFNDVDFCLRVRAAGYKVMFEAGALLFHHESVSRGKEDNPEKQRRAKAEVDYMRSEWAHVMKGDPYYNPNLNQLKPDFSLSKCPAEIFE